jgi:hypothetical protein
MEQGETPIAAGNFHLSQDMPNGRKMDVSLYVFAGDTTEELNNRVDEAMSVMERQRKRLEIPLLEAALENDRQGLANQLDAMNSLADRAQGNGSKLSSSEKTHLATTYPNNIKALKERIAKGEAALEEARAGAN